ncbi:MAG: cyclic nucleotide-binding domain-containing protein [Gemmatimonadetes bacterium]|uniref:ADP,ATP carrier protein n=1 Tax=Candidatus Kutchimonas denitrificans TaxID=3056748 RepID=A0AAE4Z798_9BACT|nr:cyclic nucleotide-binding domain-containing protein [Gemmatimonadota bacterium]NIR75080.1 cyclic nucleotide-binding domain-containing protein [Candidatus Kutchimonas denitrificans]NIS00912.1 cyclic nucleotide-binding domain-containing protein [Gemmatimonadota bacterium]NIT66529.1 cyclic nucleotide-binding domain-containing protein [Gemmatimonadota bacterium]NIU52875.1 cyclic nucleotide-binding domain-containing protein [Gemmatimonadota bacterium]
MIKALKRKLMSLTGLRPGELGRVSLMSFYFFLVITSYYVIKPVRNSLFVERLGADNLPYVYIATAIFVGFIISFYSRYADRIGRQALILGTFAFLASNLVIFWWVLKAGTLFASGAFYIWAKLYPLLLVSQFWLVANELFTTAQARRLFGLVGAGGIIGGVAGSAISGTLATVVGSENLLLVSVSILGLCALLLVYIDQRTEPVRPRPAIEEDQPPAGAWRLLRESSHLRTIAYILGLTIIVSTVVDWQFNKAIELFVPGEDAKTEFYGRFFAALNVTSVLIQLLLTSLVLRVFGLAVALLLLPIGLLTGSIGILLHPGLWTAALAKGAEGSLRYSLDQSTRELLFLPLPSDIKYRGKPLVDMVVYRGGTGVGGVLVLVATSIFAFGLREMAIVAALMIALWMGVTVAMRREFRSSVRRLIRTRDVEADELIVQHLDARTREELIAALESEDENEVLYALALLEDVDQREIVRHTQELLEHSSRRVRARTLRALYGSASEVPMAAPRALLDDPAMEVRAEAINFVCNFGDLPPMETMEEFMRSEEPGVRAAALSCLAQHADSDRAEVAAGLIREMAARQDGPDAARERRLAAEAIGATVNGKRLRDSLISLLQDTEADVRRAAVQAAARVKDPKLVPILLSHLCCGESRAEVKAALAGYRKSIRDQLVDVLLDRDVPMEVRASIPAIFYDSAGSRDVDVLIGALPQVPPRIRLAILKTLNRLRRNRDDLSFDDNRLESALELETRTGYQHVVDRAAITPNGLLGRVLREAEADALERTTRVLGLMHPLRDILAVYQGLTSGSESMRSAGFELLENTLPLRQRRFVGPLADPDLSLEDRARRGHALFDEVVDESRDDTLQRLATQTDQPWIAAVAAAAAEVEPDLAIELREPYHLHPLPGLDRTLSSLLSEDKDKMLKLIERADFLRDVEIFSEVRTEGLAKIAAITREREYEKDTELFAEGEEGSELFFIVSGQVHAIRQGELAFTADRGETVGTLTLIDARPREFTATATQHTRALVIERDDFFDLMRDHFDLVEGLLTHLTDVVRRLNARLEQEGVEA